MENTAPEPASAGTAGQSAPRRLRVGFLTTELGGGGAERTVFELARRLPESGFEVAGVWCLAPATGHYAGELAREGIAVWGAGVRSPVDLYRLFALRRSLRAARLDVLSAHLFHAAAAARWMTRGGGVGRLAVTYHYPETRRLRWLAERRLGARDAKLSAVSSVVADIAAAGLKRGRAEISVIPNGVDFAAIDERVPSARAEVRRKLGVGDGRRLIGALGRLVPEKDPLGLLEAFALVAAGDDEAMLVYIGDGPLHEAVWRRAQELDVDRRVIVTGFTPDPAGHLAALDVFAMPSRTEGQGMALVEALGAGLPVAATRIPSFVEMLGEKADGRTALIVPPGDPAALGAALRRLLVERELAARLGAAGREFVRARFGLERTVAGYAEFFRSAAGVPR